MEVVEIYRLPAFNNALSYVQRSYAFKKYVKIMFYLIQNSVGTPNPAYLMSQYEHSHIFNIEFSLRLWSLQRHLFRRKINPVWKLLAGEKLAQN